MNTFKLSAILLIFLAFASTAFASPSIELSAGQYKLTDESRTVSNDYGVFDAVADDQPATLGAAVALESGKFKVSMGARAGSVHYTAKLPSDAQSLSDSLESAKAVVDADAESIRNTDGDVELLQGLEAQSAEIQADLDSLHAPFSTSATNSGLTASAMYAATSTLSLGAEVFANKDTDEVLPSLKAEAASKHGNMTVGSTLNLGEDWVGFGTVVRF